MENPMKRPDLTVIKIGGSLLQTENFKAWVRALVPFLKKHPAVLIHGGGKEVTQLADKLGIESRFVQGRRFTDERTMEVAEMVLSGKVNPFIVSEFNRMGIAALGLSGRDGKTVSAKRVAALGSVGVPSRVRTDVIASLLRQKFVPVFSSIADDGKGGALNVNADEMASSIAESMKASRLILYTDVPGVLDASGKTIPSISLAESRTLIQSGVITGGMIPKIQSSFRALQKGIGEIWILQGSLPLAQSKGTRLSNRASSALNPFANVRP